MKTKLPTLEFMIACTIIVCQAVLIIVVSIERDTAKKERARAEATIGELMATDGKFYRDEFGHWQSADNYWKKEAQK